MWLILQHHEPDDFVIATGENHSVREFIEAAFKQVGISIAWQGEGIGERGIDAETGRVLVAVHPRYFRPTEVEELLGDPTKARELLGWRPRVSFNELVRRMMVADLKEAEMERLCRTAGFN
jgi:GDPmannose 4,6-dehydratase